nr:immunoglobulin light chain junction region [Macaca mulatta]
CQAYDSSLSAQLF